MRIRTMALIIVLAAATLLITPASHAYDTSYHFDAVQNAMKAAGFSDCAIKTAQIGNWYVDYYTNAGVGDWGKADALHFDDLFTVGDEAAHHQWLEEVLKKKIVMITSGLEPWQMRGGAEESDCLSILLTIGMGTHAIQDFYSHSNWSNIDWKAMGYTEPTTWDDVKPEDRESARDADGNGVYSGNYSADQPKGLKTHDELNTDDADRPGHVRSMNMAHRATAQWLDKFKSWIGDDCWEKLRKCCPEDKKKDIDSEWSWAKRLSEATGHWGTESVGGDILLAGPGYKATSDTILNERWKAIINQLFETPHTAGPQHAMAPEIPEGMVYVTVTVAPGEQMTFNNPYEQAILVENAVTGKVTRIQPSESLTVPADKLFYVQDPIGTTAICAEMIRTSGDSIRPKVDVPRIDAVRIGDTAIDYLPVSTSGTIPPLVVSGSMPKEPKLGLTVTGSDGAKEKVPARTICSIGTEDATVEEVLRFEDVERGVRSAVMESLNARASERFWKEMGITDASFKVKIEPETGPQGSPGTAYIDISDYLKTMDSRWGFDFRRYALQIDYSKSGGATGPTEVLIPSMQDKIEIPVVRGVIPGTFPVAFRLKPRVLMLKPNEDSFREAYDADKTNQQKQTWDDYWTRGQYFYEGRGTIPGWDFNVAGMIMGMPVEVREKIFAKAKPLGDKIGTEWAKDSGLRAIDNDDIFRWSDKMEKARKDDKGDGKKIESVLDDIDKDALLRMKGGPR